MGSSVLINQRRREKRTKIMGENRRGRNTMGEARKEGNMQSMSNPPLNRHIPSCNRYLLLDHPEEQTQQFYSGRSLKSHKLQNVLSGSILHSY